MNKFFLFLSLWFTPFAYCNNTSQFTHATDAVSSVIEKSDKGVATVYADGKNAVTTVYNDAKSIAPEIASNIKGIAKELKVGADHVWDILVMQQRVWSIGFLMLTIGAMVNWILFYKRNRKPDSKDITWVTLERDVIEETPNPHYDQFYGNRAEYANDHRAKRTIKKPTGGKEQYQAPQHIDLVTEETAFQTFVKILHLVICLALSALSIYNFSSMLTGFLNPEFGAMKDIILFTSSLK